MKTVERDPKAGQEPIIRPKERHLQRKGESNCKKSPKGEKRGESHHPMGEGSGETHKDEAVKQMIKW